VSRQVTIFGHFGRATRDSRPAETHESSDTYIPTGERGVAEWSGENLREFFQGIAMNAGSHGHSNEGSSVRVCICATDSVF